ncbi:MAG: DUF3095 domain-containing protein [Leptolyngbya sp.]|nr:DUF3095 domain-containing protein [Leptolyngbya sp.]
MASEDFYRSIPVLERFIDLADPAHYRTAPADWYVLMTDVAGSTAAIERGQYKAVNVLGASSIMAVLNVIAPLEVPFVFGGDGAVLLVPPVALGQARAALLGLKTIAQEAFGLRLRVGVVPVSALAPDRPVKVAKFRLTPTYCQANFLGGGITDAETLIKTEAMYRLEQGGDPAAANLTGLECRWRAIPSEPGHTLSLIVTAPNQEKSPSPDLFQEVLDAIQTLYGDPLSYHPVALNRLTVSLNPLQLWAEVKARSPQSRRWIDWARTYLEALLGYGLMTLNIQAGGVDWGRYRQDVWAASDYQKLDDSLRMVMVGTPAQTQQLTDYLEDRYQRGQLVYGLHVSDRALMTCLILNRRDCHFHLIDSADGGYALAAKQLKARLKA